MKTRHLLMSAGLIAAAWLAFFGDKSGDAGIAEPAAHQSRPQDSIAADTAEKRGTRSSTAIETQPQISQGADEVHIQALQLRADLMDPASGEAGLFSSKSWTPPPPKIAKLAALPPPPPAAPPLPFTYLGKQTAGGQIEVFLASGDKVFAAREQDVIQNTYRVESIKPPILSMIYLPLNEIQRLSIGVTN